jgi:O-antigen/teichoic acid export membrane protein
MSLVRNSAWNVLGVVLPSLIAIPAFAVYARGLGVERLGLLTIALTLLGYASSFDLGLSRALIRQVSIDRGDRVAVRSLISTATLAVAALAVALAALAWVCVPALVRYLNVSADNVADAQAGMRWLALTIVPYLLGLVASSYFEGLESFGTVNVIRVATAGLNAVAGVGALLVEPTLASVLLALFVSRVLTCLLTYGWYRHDVGARGAARRFDGAQLAHLMRYGSWLTVSNVVGPLMSHFDRFVLSHMSGAAVVALYTVPAEAVLRMSMFPSAIAKALFPRLSRGGDTMRTDRRTARRLTLLSCVLTLLPMFLLADWILLVWVGEEYIGLPGVVLRILVVGWFFNALTLDPFTHLQAAGQSRVTALVHVAELLPYLALLVALTSAYGIVGTAIAWSVRSFADFLLMSFHARRFDRH